MDVKCYKIIEDSQIQETNIILREMRDYSAFERSATNATGALNQVTSAQPHHYPIRSLQDKKCK